MYLTLLKDHCRRAEVSVLAWCMMTNHVHLVAIPGHETALARALGRTHNEYARWLHVRERRVGHLWQNRFHSCPLERQHVWDALLYVELNPVRAGMAHHAWEWPWSSAGVHVHGADPWHLIDGEWWRQQGDPGWWTQVLKSGFQDASIAVRMREVTRTGRPYGGDEFVAEIEHRLSRRLRPLPRGPQPKSTPLVGQSSFGVA